MIAPDPEALWEAYQTASQYAADLWRSYRMIRKAVYTDGTSGLIYGQAYQAQQAADAAYETWRKAQAAANPGVTG